MIRLLIFAVGLIVLPVVIVQTVRAVQGGTPCMRMSR